VSWIDGPLLSFDVESTGVDVETDRIICATLISIGSRNEGRPVRPATEWINPGISIPPGATAIHGITDEKIQQVGEPPPETLEAIALLLAALCNDGVPIVGMNLSYDLTMLDRECRRHGVQPLADRCPVAPVIDVMVLDKRVDPYRKGSGRRKLTALCEIYRIEHGGAHDSAHDALAAARVAYRIGRMYPRVGELDAMSLHELQIGWKAEQDRNFARWLKSQGKDASTCDGQWPYRRLATVAQLEEEPALW
jgi:DNA polymerase III subunit epsilon